ncbi:probable LRR receptor-like serine/threonine-protein kinase At2g28960 isoform X2 [Aristolochia californica]|uniref:probable LRR receptor-like serine/threonine-protein kinase At2g28960 isoform X2 n=1 Tax=Aristolochia californica TaxID=171875 RepID=UPI0035D9EBE3
MAKRVVSSRKLHLSTCWKLHPLTILVLIFPFILKLVNTQSPRTKCNLDFQKSYRRNFSACEGGNWGGFLTQNCCGGALDGYLYALGQTANRTGQIYLNASEQSSCLDQMKNLDADVMICGIERLTSGAGGCSDFTVNDVINKLGDRLGSLANNCMFSRDDGGFNSKCVSCLETWEKLRQTMGSTGGLLQNDVNVCRFAVLVTLISQRTDNIHWVQALYKCLGESDYGGDVPKSKTRRSKIGPALLVAGIIGIVVVLIFVAWIVLKKRTRSNVSLSSHREASKDLLPDVPGCQKIPTKEIYAATKNLNVLNFIGEGIAGKVYKGVLSNGRHVAVKHIVKDGYAETFVREVTSLSHVRHPNLVSLLGYCEEEEECFLIYELCSNGNLSEWLYGGEKALSWIQRLEIAIDSAQGLWFLHSYPEGCIVHRDIKPTNILLDDNLQAKLSDFGLSKIIDHGRSYVSSEVRGTFGYVDPEYRRNHQVNPSGDVYSFGIVLLQIISGKRVINLNLKKPMSLHKMAKLFIREGNMMEFADPKMNGEFTREAFYITLRLALSCTAHKQQRPTMEEVITRLEEALDISSSSKATRSDLSF